jgi:SAM-dependent methyltransferase
MPARERSHARSRSLWNVRTVAWYRRANARSDYAERVLAAVPELLARSLTALDVGAGFGALALPLARRMERVTAVEPAPAMAAALRDTITHERLANLALIEAAWGDVPVGPHDLVVCAHVSGLLKRGSPLLAALARGGLARRGVALVRDAPGGEDKFYFRELYPVLLGRAYDKAWCGADETLEELTRLGVKPTLTPIEYRSDQPFDDLEEACDFWMEYMGLEAPDVRAYLRGFLATRLTREARGWLAPFCKRAVVIQWPTRSDAARGR